LELKTIESSNKQSLVVTAPASLAHQEVLAESGPTPRAPAFGVKLHEPSICAEKLMVFEGIQIVFSTPLSTHANSTLKISNYVLNLFFKNTIFE
jgi:hypothetical protein